MATKTRSDLIDTVSRRLGIAQEEGVSEGYEWNRIGDCYDTEYEGLEADEIAYWPSNEIPAAVFQPLAMYIAAIVAPELASGEFQADAESKIVAAKTALQARCAKKWDGGPTTPDRF